MLLFRRLLLLWLLMLWQGGFTFYSAVVVPIGTEVLGSAENQGWITRRVTNSLNAVAVPALLVWAWDLAADPAPTRPRRLGHWLLWTSLALLLVALAGLHVWMDGLLDADEFRVLDRPTFRTLHRWYLWLSTVQWAGSIVLSLGTLQAWRASDVWRAELAVAREPDSSGAMGPQ
jgi:hypothetical protein